MAFNAKDILAKAKQDAEEKAKRAEEERLAAIEAEKQRVAKEAEEKALHEKVEAEQKERERKEREEKARREQEEREQRELEEKKQLEAEKVRIQEELKQKAEEEKKRNTKDCESQMEKHLKEMKRLVSSKGADNFFYMQKVLNQAKDLLNKNVYYEEIPCLDEFKDTMDKLNERESKDRSKYYKRERIKGKFKWVGIIAVCAGLIGLLTFSIVKGAAKPKEMYAIGTKGQGGIVFYDKGEYSNGWRYLECSLQYLGETYYCKDRKMITGLSSVIGEGDFNTDNLISFKGEDTAAAKARAYRGGGYEDWYLPNRAEATAMYKALAKGKGKNRAKKVSGYEKMHQGFFESPSTWTSEMFNNDKAYYMATDSYDGKIYEGWVYTYTFMGMELTNSKSIRPIRKF